MVSKGQVAILTDKITLQLASYKLYFLLPLHNDENDQNPSILEIPNPEYEAFISATLKAKTVRKRSIEPYSGTSAAVHEEDELSVEELMQKMSDAIKVNQWDRRQQMLGTTIAHHAVLDAARSTECQKIAKKMNGTVSRYVVAHSLSPCSFPSFYVYFSRFASQLFVLEYTVPFLKYILYYGSRSEIMKWIKNSPKYYNWVSEMQSRMNSKVIKVVLERLSIEQGLSEPEQLADMYDGFYLVTFTWTLQSPILTQIMVLKKKERATIQKANLDLYMLIPTSTVKTPIMLSRILRAKIIRSMSTMVMRMRKC